MTNQRLMSQRHPGHRVDTCVDLSLRGHPRKAAHFIPQQGRKRNTDSAGRQNTSSHGLFMAPDRSGIADRRGLPGWSVRIASL